MRIFVQGQGLQKNNRNENYNFKNISWCGIGMHRSQPNRFQEFFDEGKYIFLKNYLYNYLLRKMAVEKSLQHEMTGLILEVGSMLPAWIDARIMPRSLAAVLLIKAEKK